MPDPALTNTLAIATAVGLLSLAAALLSLVWYPVYRHRTHAEFAQADQIRMLRIAISQEGEKIVSKTAELNQAVTDLSVAANAVAAAIGQGGANSTPDADVAAGVASIQGIVGQLNALVTPTPPTP